MRLKCSILHRGQRLSVEVTAGSAKYALSQGQGPVHILHHREPLTVAGSEPVVRPIPQAPERSQPSQPPGPSPHRRPRPDDTPAQLALAYNMVMANLSRAYSENVQGNFFVDDTCIDCDLCRQIAPSVFQDEGDHSAVFHQPDSAPEATRAAMALVACPTGSIGTHEKLDIRAAAASYPELIGENVYFCGYASPNSYGAASYVITRPEGNVLVDCPRFARTLVKRIEEMGGISLIFFSHRDDVADHRKFHEHFGCPRIIHRADAGGIETEQVMDGQEPVALDQDLLAIPVPGHTRGHVVLLYKNKFLFTGDHLAWSDNRGGLIAFRDVAWYSWPEQTKSMKRLLDYEFEWVLPGHGRRAHQPRDVMRRKLIDCITWMEKTH